MSPAASVTIEDVKNFLARHPQGILLNVLTPEKHARQHIPGSKQACIFETAFLDHMFRIAPDKNAKILVYGAGSSMDAEDAKTALLEAGYTDILVFLGGLEAWRAACLPLEGTATEADDPPYPPLFPLHAKYELVASESAIRWTGRNDSKAHWGYLPLKAGQLRFENNIGSGEATADMTAISCYDLTPASGVIELLFHLASRDFFDTKNFPEAYVQVNSLTPLKNASSALPNYQAQGVFIIKGIEQPVEGPVSVRNLADDKLSVSGQINLDRTKWGVLYGSSRFYRFLGMHKIDDLISLDAFLVGKAVQ